MQTTISVNSDNFIPSQAFDFLLPYVVFARTPVVLSARATEGVFCLVPGFKGNAFSVFHGEYLCRVFIDAFHQAKKLILFLVWFLSQMGVECCQMLLSPSILVTHFSSFNLL